MTIPSQDQTQEVKVDTSEVNLSKQRKFYEKQLESERLEKQQLQERLLMAEKANKEREKQSPLNEDDDDEPYIDKKRLNKTLHSFEEKMEKRIDQRAHEKAMAIVDAEKRENYLSANSDFDHVMSPEILEKFSEKHPKLASSILKMPDGFERQKLVYENIKAFGLDKPEQKSSVQDKIDSNRKAPFYQPTSVGTSPYAPHSDFSAQGQKAAYTKMMELKNRMRIG